MRKSNGIIKNGSKNTQVGGNYIVNIYYIVGEDIPASVLERLSIDLKRKGGAR